jgi:hypothetical protein
LQMVGVENHSAKTDALPHVPHAFLQSIIVGTVAHVGKVSSRFRRTALLSIWASRSRKPARWISSPMTKCTTTHSL